MKSFSFLTILAFALIMMVPAEATGFERVLKGGADDGPCVGLGSKCVDDDNCCSTTAVCTPMSYTAAVSVEIGLCIVGVCAGVS